MSYMLKEARESAAIVANQDTSQALALAEALKSQTPRGIVSVAAPPTTPSATSATSSCTRAAWRSPRCRRP